MKFLRSKLALFFASLFAFGSLAYATAYYGYNPSTGGEVTHGVTIDGGNVKPVISGTCGTRGTQLGGATTGSVVSGAVTTCTTVLTFAVAAPNGYFCSFQDLTTVADKIGQVSYTTTSCTSNAATIVSGDLVAFQAEGF